MMQVLIIFGWLIALGMMLHLAKEALRTRFSKSRPSRRTTSKPRIFRWRRRFDSAQQTIDEPAVPGDRFWFGTKVVGYVVLLLWEAFWISEIMERSSETSKAWQLPYVFLLIVMVGVPLAVYFVARKFLRRSAEAA